MIEAVQAMIPYTNYYPEDAISNVRLLKALAEYVGLPGGDEKWVALGNGSWRSLTCSRIRLLMKATRSFCLLRNILPMPAAR